MNSNMFIQVFPVDSPFRKALERFAELLTQKSPRGYQYYVGETYFDFGQKWWWTTILCKGYKYGDYQALNPREQEEMILCDTDKEAEDIVTKYFQSEFCPDKM